MTIEIPQWWLWVVAAWFTLPFVFLAIWWVCIVLIDRSDRRRRNLRKRR